MIKNAGPLRLGAGRLLAFLGPEMQGGRAAAGVGGAVGGCQVSVVMVCRGWLGGGDPAAICGGNSAVFNQPLTILLVVAMVWWLSVFFLCSYRQFRRCWRLFRSPGAGRWWSVPGAVLGCWLLDQEMGGVAEKGTVLLRMGVEYCPTSSPPLHGLWGWRKTGRGSFCNPGQK